MRKEWIVTVPCTITVYVKALTEEDAIEDACEEIEQSGADPELTEIHDTDEITAEQE